MKKKERRSKEEIPFGGKRFYQPDEGFVTHLEVHDDTIQHSHVSRLTSLVQHNCTSFPSLRCIVSSLKYPYIFKYNRKRSIQRLNSKDLILAIINTIEITAGLNKSHDKASYIYIYIVFFGNLHKR